MFPCTSEFHFLAFLSAGLFAAGFSAASFLTAFFVVDLFQIWISVRFLLTIQICESRMKKIYLQRRFIKKAVAQAFFEIYI